jgi:hypothetical protein
MPYIDESLREIEYAFDVLKVNGIGMRASYGHIVALLSAVHAVVRRTGSP